MLNQLDNLEDLILFCCGISDVTLTVISGFQHLKHLELRELHGIDGLTGAGFRVLDGSPFSETLQSITVELFEAYNSYLSVQDFDIAEMVAGIAVTTCAKLI